MESTCLNDGTASSCAAANAGAARHAAASKARMGWRGGVRRRCKAMAIGERLFANKCATCHGSDVGGSKGFPN